MIILRINVQNISQVLVAGHDEIVVYSDTTQGGTFATEVGTVALAPNQQNYEYEDPAGDLTTWYEVSYRDTDPSPIAESPKSEPFQGITSRGPLGLISIGYLRANTDFPLLAALGDGKLAEFIWRAEQLIEIFADDYGGLDNTIANYGVMVGIAVRMVAENLYVMSNPQARARRANGLQSEKIGSYQYTVAKGLLTPNPFDFGGEVLAILYWFMHNTKLIFSMNTTQVFPELKVDPGNPLTPQLLGVSIRAWHDFTDIQLSRPVLQVGGVWTEDAFSRIGP